MRRRPELIKLTLMQERLLGAAAGALLGVAVWLWRAPDFCTAATHGDPLSGTATFTYTNLALGVTTLVGMLLIAVGFVVGMDRQFFNFMAVGAGAGLLLLAVPWFAMERVEVTPQGFTCRSWWGLSTRRFDFNDLAEFRLQHHTRLWGRRSFWTSVHYKLKSGEEGTLCSDTWRDPLWFWASPHVVRLSRGAGILAP